MFGSVSKKEHDLEVYQAYSRGFNAAKNDLDLLMQNNEIFYQALQLIAELELTDKDGDAARSMQRTARSAINWHESHMPSVYVAGKRSEEDK
jgi:hypothetical protein